MTGSVKLMRLENKMNIQRQQGGSQRDWDAVRQHSDLPIITIITSTYNVVQYLQWTIDSIREQTYPNIQWIIADGASTDGTVAMFEANNELIDYWFSEPDTGIYDAWNKALEHVKGDWVQFIGAGDELYETNTLEKVAHYLKDAYPSYHFVYGKVQYISESLRQSLYIEGKPWNQHKNSYCGNRPSLPEHPVTFHNVSLFATHKFETKFKIVADSHLLMQNLDKDYLYLPLIIDKMVRGGVSSTPQGILQCYQELKRSTKMLGIKLPFIIRFNSVLRYLFIKNMLFFFSEKQYRYVSDIIRTIVGKQKIHTID